MQGAFNDVIFTFSKDANRKSTLKLLDHELEGYGGLGAYDREKLPSHSFLRDEFKQLRTTAYAMPMIFLGVASSFVSVLSASKLKESPSPSNLLTAFLSIYAP